jgi:hypothetical protein
MPTKLYQPYDSTRLRYASEAAYDNNERPVGIKCDCGCLLSWSPGYDETCDRCGTEYNSSGTQLAPRHQWGEETGESFGVGGEF